jgi:hypothetical protein
VKKKMRRRVLAEAFTLADIVAQRLAERGVPPCLMPSRDEVVAAVMPIARKQAKARKLAMDTAHGAIWARGELERELAWGTRRLERVTAGFADVPVPALPGRLARTVEFRPGNWRDPGATGLVPVGGREREVA